MKNKPRAGLIASTLAFAVAAVGALPGAPAGATEVNVVGLFPGKAIVSINGGAPRTISVGQKTPEGVILVSSGGDSAVLDIDGKRSSLRLGEAYAAQPAAGGGGNESVILTADSGGHYRGLARVNGHMAQILVDTGASMVWMSSELADQLGVAWRRGTPFTVQTAGGAKQAFGVVLQNVRVGGISLDNVEAAVGEGAGTGGTMLLGMSFLSRVIFNRDGARLLLSRKEGALVQDARDKRPRLTLKDTGSGAFASMVTINGASLPFVVDTGATNVAIDTAMARRAGVNYESGTPSMSSTANGLMRTWRVKFDSVTIGPITLYGVDGSVVEGAGFGGVGLLGMSFLNRIEMHREGEAMTLIKRF
ncbi:MAG: hypothetical protein JWN73_960 [Betaproteobacteria bacterium]|nr:hypothetical protein [Betaproteobacteria bacterium]